MSFSSKQGCENGFANRRRRVDFSLFYKGFPGGRRVSKQKTRRWRIFAPRSARYREFAKQSVIATMNDHIAALGRLPPTRNRHRRCGMGLREGKPLALCCRMIAPCRNRRLLRGLSTPSTSRRENEPPARFPLARPTGNRHRFCGMGLREGKPLTLCCRMIALCRNRRLLRGLSTPSTSRRENEPPARFPLARPTGNRHRFCGMGLRGVEAPPPTGNTLRSERHGRREGAGTQDIRSFRAVEHKMWWFCEDRGVKKPTKSKMFLMGFW